MKSETFRHSWTGRIISSAGYSVRVGGRTGVDYKDEVRRLHIDSELMVSSAEEIVVYERSIPDADGSRGLVLDRLVRALAFDGLRVTVQAD